MSQALVESPFVASFFETTIPVIIERVDDGTCRLPIGQGHVDLKPGVV
jgi:hypothetical protein